MYYSTKRCGFFCAVWIHLDFYSSLKLSNQVQTTSDFRRNTSDGYHRHTVQEKIYVDKLLSTFYMVHILRRSFVLFTIISITEKGSPWGRNYPYRLVQGMTDKLLHSV